VTLKYVFVVVSIIRCQQVLQLVQLIFFDFPYARSYSQRT
jgi:hypothetical protein